MKKFDILDPDLDLFQSCFLEASAGTGKTFTIEHLVVRLLLESDPPFALRQILAVTFTREAAYEMQKRIRIHLEKRLIEGDPKVAKALAEFDELQVFTIHGFCHRVLSEFAFEAGVSFDSPSFELRHPLIEMEQTVRDFLSIGEGKFAPEVATLFRRSRFDLQRLIYQIIGEMSLNVPPLEVDFPALPIASLADLRADFYTLAPRYKRFKTEVYEPQLARFVTYLCEKKTALLFEEKEWFFEKMGEENAKVKAGPIDFSSLRVPTLFKKLIKDFVKPLQIVRDPKQMVRRIAKECRELWKTKATRGEYLSFDGLLYAMKKALNHPRFIKRVQEKYKVAIIDEFQDTDPIQWEIFRKLFHPTHIVYLVGDPKQSIYGFRSADIYTYMDAARLFSDENRAFLDTNFRSSPSLIEALNALFVSRPGWLKLPKDPGTLFYSPVKAGRTSAELDEKPLVFFGLRSDLGKRRSWPTQQMEEEKLFPYIASEILRLREFFPFSEMALLVKDRFQGQRVEGYLGRFSIPAGLKRTESLANSRGFFALSDLLYATLDPNRKGRVHAALQGPLLLGKEISFFLWQEVFDQKGFAYLFTEWIAQHFIAHPDRSLIEEIEQTAEILIEYPGYNLKELLFEMERLAKLSPDSEPRLKLRNLSEEDRVPILTTFASKGLEFAIVFALGLASRHYAEQGDPEKEAEKLRQLYVGFTRAREKLYIPYLIDTSSRPIPYGAASPIELFCQEIPSPITWIGDPSPSPYQKGRGSPHLIAPKVLNLTFPTRRLTSFSTLAKSLHKRVVSSERFGAQDFRIKTPHTLPLGVETGSLVHQVFESHFQNRSHCLEEILLELVPGTHLEGWEEVIIEIVEQACVLPLEGGFCLKDLKEGQYMQEMEFLFPKGDQLIKGFVDLVFMRGDTFYLLDWKTNWLGPSDSDYTEENLWKAMEEHDYLLQADLYSEALMRYAKLFVKKPQYGGAFYLFVRGKKGVHIGAC